MGGFFQLRYMMALVVAISIDTIQFLLGVAIAAVFNVPGVAGAIVGCVAGEKLVDSCWLGGAVGGALHLAAVFFSAGTFQGVLMAIGAGLAVVISFSIAATFGTGLVFLMWFTGIIPAGQIFSFRRLWALAEILPGINFFPAWTAMAATDIIADRAATMGGVLGSVARIAAAAATGNVAGAATAAAKEAGGTTKSAPRRAPAGEVEGVMEPETRARGRVPLANTIRSSGGEPQAANDNKPASHTPSVRERNTASKQLMAA